MGDKKNAWVKSLLYTWTGGAWLVLSHISHNLHWRLTGQRCIMCSAEPEQCNYPPSEARVCSKRFLSSMNELEGEGLLACMKGRKLQLSNYCFMSQEIWPPWRNVCVINLARQPEYVRTRVVTNAARNAPELLLSCCSWSSCCHQGVCPGSTRSALPAPSSCWQCCRYCGHTSPLAQSEVELHRRREAGSKRGVVFLSSLEDLEGAGGLCWCECP